MHYLGVFYNNALSQKILFKQEKKNVSAEQPVSPVTQIPEKQVKSQK